jgi:hypothetical protein
VSDFREDVYKPYDEGKSKFIYIGQPRISLSDTEFYMMYQVKQFKVFNLLGQELISSDINLTGKYQVVDIDISKLKSGTYVYSIISSDKEVNTGKFVIVK